MNGGIAFAATTTASVTLPIPKTCFNLVLKNTLKAGDTDKTKNGEVSKLQKYLQNTIAPTLTISGVYGVKTTQAVKDFQSKSGLPLSGIVAKATQQKINEQCAIPVTKSAQGSLSKVASFTLVTNEYGSDSVLLLSSGKLAYISSDSKTEKKILYLDGVKVDESQYISQLTDVSGRLAYVTRDENATTSSLVYDGKKIVKAAPSIQIVNGINDTLVYTIYDPKIQKTSIYSGSNRMSEVVSGSVSTSDIKKTKDSFVYSVTHGGDSFDNRNSNIALFYDGRKINNILFSPMMGPVFGFINDILFYETYASTTKTFELFYGDKRVSFGSSFFIPLTAIGGELVYVEYGNDKKVSLYQGAVKITSGDDIRNVRIIANKLAYSLVDKEKKKEILFWGGKEIASLSTDDSSSGVGFFDLKEINGEPSYTIQKSLLDKKLVINRKEIANSGTFPQVKSVGGKLLYVVKKNEKDSMSFGKEDVFYNGTTTSIDGLINFPGKDFTKGIITTPYYFYSSKSFPEKRDPVTKIATFTKVLTIYKVD
jgi:peptidoglycan hydrolase-like protein with peptidoglycan-binding domain